MTRHAKAEPANDAAIERRQRIVAWVGAVLAAVGVVGILLDRSLLVLWVFMIAFGVAKLPKAVYDRIRGRGR
jgi:hypothetical protein